MNIGAYTACLHNYTLEESLDILKGNGLTGAEVNVGGFIPSPHCPVDLLIGSKTARDDYLGIFADKGMRLAGFNCSGNVLSPLPDVGPRHDYDLRRAIELAGKLGVDEIVCMSGTPGTDPDAKYPAWVVNPWNGVELEVLEYQKSVADPYWREMDKRAQDAGVKLAWELHPHNIAFTPVNFLEFAERIDAKNVGVNMDPSHLMWQQMDIVASIKLLGDHIFHVHAKDTKLYPGVATRGVIDSSFGPVPENPADRTPTGMSHYCSSWPEDPAWRFVGIGVGHDVAWWTEFLRAIKDINPEMNVNIEHEDQSMSQLDGIAFAAKNLLEAEKAA
ncbi:sugar phosphate isomerase/epimerase [Acidipropionibacterium acidipropionici]|uniref:Sugar phosphate isomerase n=1 Tax=Acidipropionibacterium acidipropionici TaxID=1748 RepID=A0AAC9FC86_9ACTN|nr:sugar phosphate isomerase/epimerase [Acidipropionibacterium acidipropionici]AMS05728.1 sugar phosphate isomerase [Acidipropionibacterium acidipropionici]AOZ47196.1 sugar phosphate isomerase [Acidipropionibacterium acidipropionici]AZP36698.1 sugar phosphate isomerase/epimerase [Acidipropionibacterium acidipropionici]